MTLGEAASFCRECRTVQDAAVGHQQPLLLAAGEMSAEVLREDPGDGPWRPLREFVLPT